MQKLMTAPQYRRYKIMNIFSEFQNFWLNFDQLANKADMSKRILNTTMAELEHYGVVWDYRDNSVRLNLSRSSSLDAIYRELLNEISAFSIIEEIFFDPNVTITNLADKLNVSRATAYRYINNLNDSLLNRFKISINTKTCKFEGREEDIRYFFSEFFAEKYPVFDWPFGDDDHYDLINSGIELLGSYVLDKSKQSYKLNFAYKHFMKISVAVNTNRLIQGYRIKDYKTPVERLYPLAQIDPRFISYKRRMEKYVDGKLKFDFDFIKQTYAMVMKSTFFFSVEDFYDTSFKDHYIRKSVTLLNKTLAKIKDEFGLEPRDSEKFVMQIHNSHHIGQLKLYVQPILFDRKSLALHDFRYMNPDLYNLIESEMKHYREELNIEANKYLANHIMYAFYTSWGNITDELVKNRKKFSVGVINIFDTDNAKNAARVINNTLGSYCEAVVINDDPLLDRKKLAESEYDVIVSNFHIEPIPGKEVFVFTTPDDIYLLQERVNHKLQTEYLEHAFSNGQI